jgi:hypothetical protein
MENKNKKITLKYIKYWMNLIKCSFKDKYSLDKNNHA